MKVLHIIDSLGLGGAQTVVKGIMEAQKDNSEIFLFALRKNSINLIISHENVVIHDSESKYSLKPLFALKQLIQIQKIDVIHCHLFRSNVFGTLLKLLFFPRIALVIHEHGQILQKGELYPFVLRVAKIQITKVIAVSTMAKTTIAQRTGVADSKIVRLMNSVDLSQFQKLSTKEERRSGRRELGIVDGEIVIGFMGRLDRVKGCELLINALPKLIFPYKCLIYGSGIESARLMALAQSNGVSNLVKFMGYTDDPIKAYSIFDVFVLPSLGEACPMALLEANAAGVPILASNIPAILEFLPENAGSVFDSGNSSDLAKQLNSLVRNKDLMQFYVKNGLNLSDGRSRTQYVAALGDIYRECVNYNNSRI